MKKKIILITSFGEDFLKSRINFLQYLKKLNFDTVSVVPDDRFKEKITDLYTDNIYFYKYKRSFLAVFYVVNVALLFKKIIKKENPDIIFTYKFFPNLVGIFIAKKLNVNKIVGTVAGLGFLDKYKKSPIVYIIFILYIFILDKANYIVVQNSDDRDILRKYIDINKIILTNGSGVDYKEVCKQTVAISKNDYNLCENNLYFLFYSRIVKEKGIYELIEAFSNISRKKSKIGLIIAGWFDDRKIEADIQKKINVNEKIFFMGYQENIEELISVSDCVILPSYYAEGIPRSLTEALAMSKPIITTNHRGCKETCINGVNGYLVDIKNVKNLEEKMMDYIVLSEKKRKKCRWPVMIYSRINLNKRLFLRQ